MDRINLFLAFVRAEIEANPEFAPCDPASVGKMLVWLQAMAGAFVADEAVITAAQSSARDVMRQSLTDGIRAALRGNGNG